MDYIKVMKPFIVLEVCDRLSTKKQNVALQLHGCLSTNMRHNLYGQGV